MIYSTKAKITVDTKTNKLVIETEDKRIALTPVTRTGSDVYAIVDDKPAPQTTSAASLIRWLCQGTLITRRVVKRIPPLEPKP